jgi:hypothetical protein
MIHHLILMLNVQLIYPHALLLGLEDVKRKDHVHLINLLFNVRIAQLENVSGIPLN